MKFYDGKDYFDADIEFKDGGLLVTEVWKVNSPSTLYKSNNYFESLNLLRQNLEQSGIKICCNGARVDFYPSRMALQMSEGKVGYELVSGIPATEKVKTFGEYLDVNKIVSVEEQRAFYHSWRNSL